MSPFEPIGPRARWRILYDLLRTKKVNETITYEEMGRTLDLDPDGDRSTIQMAMRRAGKELETEDQHAIDAEPNVGYRIVEVAEHLSLAKRQQRRSSRALVRGHSKVTNVDLNGVEPEIRKAFEVVAVAFSMQMDFNRRLDVRQKRLESAVGAITERHDRSEAEITELRSRLDRLEREREDSVPKAAIEAKMREASDEVRALGEEGAR